MEDEQNPKKIIGKTRQAKTSKKCCQTTEKGQKMREKILTRKKGLTSIQLRLPKRPTVTSTNTSQYL